MRWEAFISMRCAVRAYRACSEVCAIAAVIYIVILRESHCDYGYIGAVLSFVLSTQKESISRARFGLSCFKH